jgi:predicted small metal-binding protein
MEEKEELMQDIVDSIREVAAEKECLKIKSLSVYDPEKVAKLLYLYSTGSSQTRLVRKYGYDRETVISVLADYADHLGKFKDLSGRIAAKAYLNLSSLEEDLIEKVRDRMETDPKMEVSFKDLKELSIAKANSAREALTARGEATQITEDRKVYTQEDYEATIKAAKDRIEKARIINADTGEVEDE